VRVDVFTELSQNKPVADAAAVADESNMAVIHETDPGIQNPPAKLGSLCAKLFGGVTNEMASQSQLLTSKQIIGLFVPMFAIGSFQY
jgi:hypothetical protein